MRGKVGENDRAARQGHRSREYWSRRLRGMWGWGKAGKLLTHRVERAAARREEWGAKHMVDE